MKRILPVVLVIVASARSVAAHDLFLKPFRFFVEPQSEARVRVLNGTFAPLVFLGGFGVALAGLLLWGLGYAVQDMLLEAVVAGR